MRRDKMKDTGTLPAGDHPWEKLKAETAPLKDRPETPPPPKRRRIEPKHELREIPSPYPFDNAPAPYPFLEPKQSRRLARGQAEVERTIDLHGMTEAAAHMRLVREIPLAAAQGLKMIAVVTGRGIKPKPQTGPDRAEFRTADDFHRETGVLKARLPQWLSGPELAAFVVAYEPAHQRHGGAGAFYVRLRKLAP